MIEDESHLPVNEQSLVFRLLKRAEIRRQISSRKSVQEGAPDRIADLLEESATRIIEQDKTIKKMQEQISDLHWQVNPDRMGS